MNEKTSLFESLAIPSKAYNFPMLARIGAMINPAYSPHIDAAWLYFPSLSVSKKKRRLFEGFDDYELSRAFFNPNSREQEEISNILGEIGRVLTRNDQELHVRQHELCAHPLLTKNSSYWVLMQAFNFASLFSFLDLTMESSWFEIERNEKNLRELFGHFEFLESVYEKLHGNWRFSQESIAHVLSFPLTTKPKYTKYFSKLCDILGLREGFNAWVKTLSVASSIDPEEAIIQIMKAKEKIDDDRVNGNISPDYRLSKFLSYYDEHEDKINELLKSTPPRDSVRRRINLKSPQWMYALFHVANEVIFLRDIRVSFGKRYFMKLVKQIQARAPFECTYRAKHIINPTFLEKMQRFGRPTFIFCKSPRSEGFIPNLEITNEHPNLIALLELNMIRDQFYENIKDMRDSIVCPGKMIFRECSENCESCEFFSGHLLSLTKRLLKHCRMIGLTR